MIQIISHSWGLFEAPNLAQAKEKFVNEVAPTDSDNFTIDEIIYGQDYLRTSQVAEIQWELEKEIIEWRRVAEIESRGLARAQQDAMEER